MAAALQKIGMDPEQQLYTSKIVDIAAAVIEIPRTAALYTQDSGHCDCCDRDVWRHLKLFIGHDNNNNPKLLSDCCLLPTPVYFLEDSRRLFELLSPVLLLLSLIVLQLIGESLDIPESAIYSILNDHIKISKVCFLWVSHSLNDEQMTRRVSWCREMLKKFDNGSSRLVNSIITGDETWLHYFDVPTKAKNKVRIFEGESTPVSVRKSRSIKKKMLAVFFTVRGVVIREILEKQKTVTAKCEVFLMMITAILIPPKALPFRMKWKILNQASYSPDLSPNNLKKILPSTRKDILEKLKRTISTKRLGLKDCQIKFHQDNARPHTAQQTLVRIYRYVWTLMPHSAYSPDMTPSDFYLFGSSGTTQDWQIPEGSAKTVADLVRDVTANFDSKSDYVFDENSQMYYNASTQFFYDPCVGLPLIQRTCSKYNFTAKIILAWRTDILDANSNLDV
ncbi:hypothetical protein LAZ67_9002838 [Cordylochernes scorpioides]|uniref:OCRE domain-containing protein n=1 Tax=Cordylochernes scorpioides TaxID=51811 RepID=A0ABY6KWV1_9ARAC|nr:hypothetical protein LAZ67_9002838 [Cordylochernes scorpioides]